MQKIMVYTAIIGDYDDLIEVKYAENNVDYYCFTDNPNIKSNTWKIIFIDNKDHLDSTYLNRKIKILGNKKIEKNYDLAIYIDGNVEFKKPISEFVKNECDLEKYDYFALIHPDRDCIYDEASICKAMKKDSAVNIDKIISLLKQEKYPKHFGLTANVFFARKTNNKDINNIQKLWWNMVNNYSKRDQLSFMYCIWKNQYKNIKYLSLLWFNNKYYFMHNHNNANIETINELRKKINLLESDQQNFQTELKEKNRQIEDLIKEIENIRTEYYKIINSKRWQIINRICNLKK